MFRGIVRWFDSKKRCGVVVPAGTETEVFLRFKTGGAIIAQNGLAMISDQRQDLPFPNSGDELVFETRQTSKGLQAKHWGFASVYDTIVETLPEVRVLMGTTLVQGNQSLDLKAVPIWRGRDLRELDQHLGLSKPLRPGRLRTGRATSSFFGCQNQAIYRLEVLIGGRWRRYERGSCQQRTRSRAPRRTRSTAPALVAA